MKRLLLTSCRSASLNCVVLERLDAFAVDRLPAESVVVTVASITAGGTAASLQTRL